MSDDKGVRMIMIHDPNGGVIIKPGENKKIHHRMDFDTFQENRIILRNFRQRSDKNSFAVPHGKTIPTRTRGQPYNAILKHIIYTSGGTFYVHDNNYLICKNLCGPIRVMPDELYCSHLKEFIDHLKNDCGVLVNSVMDC
jgi:hypothetical protein